MIIDRLYESVNKKGHVCVGLDTAVDYIPKEFFNRWTSAGEAVFEFNKSIIDATYDVAACYKVQIAYYEALGLEGLKAYKDTLKYLRQKGLIAIADIKRSDIADTAKMYAKAHFTGDFESDIVTLNPYMGLDSIEPYLEYVENKEKGLFILIRTSNKGASDIQYIDTKDGKKIYTEVGDKIYELSKKYKGDCGYSSIGGVIGCTHIDEAEKIRKDLKDMFFLIPGYGAQGGKDKDVAAYLNNGNGGVVNSSRGILLAYKKHEDGNMRFAEYAREAVVHMKRGIENAARIY